MAPPYPYPTLIYHITHIKNLASILETGGLLPLNRSPRHQSIAYEHIRERRGQTRVPLKPGGTLNDYVPFYFCPRSPMLYAVHTGSTDYWGGQTPILHLVSSVQAVHAKGLDFVFTDQHAVLLHARFFNNPHLQAWGPRKAKIPQRDLEVALYYLLQRGALQPEEWSDRVVLPEDAPQLA